MILTLMRLDIFVHYLLDGKEGKEEKKMPASRSRECILFPENTAQISKLSLRVGEYYGYPDILLLVACTTEAAIAETYKGNIDGARNAKECC